MRLAFGCLLLALGSGGGIPDLPERLEAIGDFWAAANEYLREGDTVSASDCLLSAGDTAGAMGILAGRTDTPSVILKARVYLSQWRINEALGTMDGLEGYGPADSLSVLACLMLMDFESAKRSAHGDSGLLDVIDFADRTAPMLYSPISAARLSCLPGLGHFYVDEPLRGIWALVLNAGIVGFMGYSVYRGMTTNRSYYMDALLTYNFFFNRFYGGAGASAERAARDRNEKLLDAWLKDIASQKGFDPVGIWREN
ncbi:MAG: hypothetical protein ACP5QG_01785 [candidate division WOR-3 bacterium]